MACLWQAIQHTYRSQQYTKPNWGRCMLAGTAADMGLETRDQRVALTSVDTLDRQTRMALHSLPCLARQCVVHTSTCEVC